MTIPLFAQMLLIGLATVVVLMTLLWIIGHQANNYAIVDFGWAVGLASVAITYAVLSHGYLWRNVMFAAMAGIWGLRLGFYLLLTRIIGHPEEGRYQQLRKDWKTNLPFKFFMFFQFQGILDLFLSLPFLFAALNPEPSIHTLEFAGLALFFFAKIGESTADAQLNRFKKVPANKGKTCRVGLWNYSRHPNYFFEWLIWVAWFLFALASPWGWAAVLCPALMFYFLFRVTGIPATEAQSLRTKGDDYREYQRTTSAFVPWFKKKATA